MNHNEIINTKYMKNSTLSYLDKIETIISFDPSSEEDAYNIKINQENLISKLPSAYTDHIINQQKEKTKIINLNNNQYTIINFNFSIICQNNSNNSNNNLFSNDKDLKINNKESKKHGRKKKISDKIDNEKNLCDDKSHDRYSDDNIRKKCKNIILKNALVFINEKIKEKYKGQIGLGKFNKQLKILNQKEKVNSNVNKDKEFIKKL